MSKYFSGLFVACLAISFATQVNMRTIEGTRREIGPEQEPVEVVDFRIGKAVVKQNVSFIAGDNWVSELETTIKNRSQHVIVNLAITFEMPSEERFAKIPIAWMGEGQCDYAATPSGMSIKPGESLTIKFNKNEQIETGYKKWKKTLVDNGISSIDKVRPVIEGVLFEDGRRWSRGYYLKKNPDDPNRWDVIR
jgi:hypothetical protein